MVSVPFSLEMPGSLRWRRPPTRSTPTGGQVLRWLYSTCPTTGSRHNLTSELLDRLLGPIRPSRRGNAIASVGAKASEHPRWDVANAIKRRGYPVFCTRGQNLWHHTTDAPYRWNYAGTVEEVGWIENPDGA